MIGRRAVIGLSLLSALLFCAFAVQSASAAEKESENTTAFTCVDSGVTKNGDFEDEHCDKKGPNPGKEQYRHDLLKVKETTNIEGSNDGVTESTKKFESAILRGKIGLTLTEITCEKFVTDATKSWVENSEPKAKDHRVTGTVRGEFKTCKVFKPLKCTIREPIETVAKVVGVDGLTGPKKEGNAMGLRFTGEIEEGELKKETFAKILFQGAECALKNQEFPVTGTVTATSGPGTDENQEKNKHTGATLVFKGESPEKVRMQKLHIGVEANTAEFETIATTRMAEKEGKKQNPISLTTTT